MADGVEPPPFDNEEEDIKEEDDLFTDAKEKNSSPEVEKIPDHHQNEKGMDHLLEDDDDNDDLFKGGSSEIKLDSDEEESHDSGDTVKATPKAVATGNAQAQESKPQISVSQATTAKTKVSAPSLKTVDTFDTSDDKKAYEMEIKITETSKMGDGMSAYMVYKIITKTTNPAYRRPTSTVLRRFSDFLGMHAKLAEKHVPSGVIVPPAPEKSVIGMTKVKMSKEESGSSDFVERRRAALERFLVRTAAHPTLASDHDFIEFLEKEGDLPKSTSTSALSSAGVMRLFHKVGESLEKITLRVDESDEWFEEKQQQVEALDQQLRKLHSNIETLSLHRKELSQSTATFAKSAAMLGNVEEHTALSRALSQLAETEEKIEVLHKEQSEADFFLMAELMKDYVALMGAVKDVFHERIKTYKVWKDAESTLAKKRDNKVKLEMQNKSDKITQAQVEIAEWEQKVEKGQEDFETISKNIKKEMARFEKLRVNDFKESVLKYLEVLMDNQEKLIKYWETFLPEAKAIA